MSIKDLFKKNGLGLVLIWCIMGGFSLLIIVFDYAHFGAVDWHIPLNIISVATLFTLVILYVEYRKAKNSGKW